ncbi:hypothetical protein Q1695_014644 [Nippostrongylus brasiliensis]|nr:hypothetical protein Q1695_014644 [Nippostrongylus brasiliensis]
MRRVSNDSSSVAQMAIVVYAAVGARIGRVQLATNSTYRVSGINKYFNFDPTTGWVTLRETIDREQLPEDVVELLLIASPPSLIHVLITVLDVNDNLPTFPGNFQNVSIIESSPVGTRISLLPATDHDRGPNGTVIEYGIDGDSDQFQVVSPSPELLYLETKQPLDRESRQFVVLNLTAKDGGQPPRLGSTTVYVEIVDVNDNAPTFNTTELEARWSGQASAAIVTLTATDADRGPNGQVIYSVYGPEAEQFVVKGDQVFAKTDNPTCCSSPPCTVCFITVRATDRGVPPLESTVLLKVLLSNENLHDPVINIRLHPSTVNFALIDAGAVAGRTVAVLTVTDEDGPISDASSVWISSGNEDGVFDLKTQRHFSILKLLKDSADITKSEFDLTFIASDGQLPQRTTNASLKVYNEAKLPTVPVAVERELAVSLPENSPVGSFVGQVHTNSSRCRFELRGQQQLFQVDRKSGIITTVSPLDVQLADSHVLEVLVQLPPPNIHTVTAAVTVTVADVNDHRPSIVELPDRLSISEDTAVGTVVLAVSARDEDRADNALLSYRLLNGEATEYLSIGSNSGKIIMRKAVDFEKITEFDAEIEVCDHGRPRLCDVAILPIAIQDVNDNSPEFFCSESFSVLPMNSPPGTIVTVILAKDRDSGSAGEVHYALLDSITDFSIDRSSGVVRTTAQLRPKSYKIRIGATDGHGVMSSNNVTVTLYVTTNESLIWKSGPETISLDDTMLPGDELGRYETTPPSSLTLSSPLVAAGPDGGLHLTQPVPIDIDRFHALLMASYGNISISKCVQFWVAHVDPPPSFPAKTSSLKLKRGSALGEPLIKVNANGRYNFTTNCQWLMVDNDGVVSIRELIDKSIDSVQCAVEAVDIKGRTDRLNITIDMEDEEAPLHLNATYVVHVREDSRPGTILLRLASNPNYLFTSALKAAVDVFPDGTVYLSDTLEGVYVDVISLPIIARHRTLNHTYSTTIRVFLDDVNDHSPKCSERRLFSIEENADIGTVLGFLEAEDEDSGLNGVLGYRLLDNHHLIQLGGVSGKISSATVFDAEKMERIDFKYEVYDHGTPSKAVICNASVEITDLNDNIPSFDQQVYTVTVAANDPSQNRTIITVHATDGDRTSKIVYKLLNYLYMFEVDAHSGVVSRIGRLQPDSRFNISIGAVDEDGLISTAILIVTTSSDEAAVPAFDKKEPFRISSSTVLGSVIGRVRAVAGRHVVRYHLSDDRFDIDSWGNVILTDELTKPGTYEFIVTAATAHRNSSSVQKVVVIDAGDGGVGGMTFRVKENTAPEMIAELDGDFELLLIVPSSSAFEFVGRKLIVARPLDAEVSSIYHILVGNKKTSRLITVQVDDVNDNDPECLTTALLVESLPFSSTFRCSDADSGGNTQLSYRTTSSAATISSDGVLNVTSLDGVVTMVTIVVSDGENTTNRRTKSFDLLLIRGDVVDRDITFASKEISMLLPSSQPIGTTLGRITAEASSPLKYYAVGSSLIEIDENNGVVSTRRKSTGDETVAIVAVSPEGIATVTVNIELIEDSLTLSHNEFLFVTSTLAAGQTLGRVDVGRDDVSVELSDPFVYSRGTELLLRKRLDMTDKHFYNCSAVIRRGRLSASITIYILQSTLNRPDTHGDDPLVYWIRENAPYGSVVGRAPSTGKGPAKYSIVGDVGLSIDEESGTIRTSSVFDHELRQLYRFVIRATLPNGDLIHLDALLSIDDENDNVPKFLREKYTVEIDEDVSPGTEIMKLQWSDEDFNNVFHFTIVEGNELQQFEVNEDGVVSIAGRLDRERLSTHRLVIRLTDGVYPYPYHPTECEVFVSVVDVNDNAPVFVSPAQFQVEENSPRMKIFGRVKASDADEGQNAVVYYRIDPESLPRAEFIIDAVKGDLMVNRALDYEKTSNFTFTVIAMDYGTPQLQSLQQVTVHIVDVNDHEPVLRSASTSTVVAEDVARGSSVMQFAVEDDDSMENSASVFAIEEGYGVFDVTSTSGQLFLSSPLDFENRTEYNVTVSATNIAGGAKTFASVTVLVKDVNDESPRFVGGSPVQFFIYENLPGPFPAVIGSTISEDLDDGENGLVAYSILKGNASLFSINSATGELLVLAPLDREENTEHFLTVQAIDSGSPRLSSTADIKITVLDENDNSPEFDQPYYVVHVLESARIGQTVLKVNAVDGDEGENAVIRYSILESSPFSIDKNTGEVRVASDLDRELADSYELTIQAADSGRYRRLKSSVRVTVIVDDENDNNPVIRNTLMDVFVPRDLQLGDVVHVVDAVDPDENSTVLFNCSGPDARFLDINNRGEIVTKTTLDSKAYYSITVAAFDDAGLNTSASFTFYLDQRQLFPRWTRTTNSTTVKENSAMEIFRFEADSPRKDTYITYSILAGNDGSFDIDPLSGRLSISKGLDHEKRQSYRLWLAATDSDSPPKISITFIDIAVEGVNDNSPQFEKVVYSAGILENSEPQQLLCVAATDRDSGDNGEFSYEIVTGDTTASFTIDPQSGCVRSTKELDREERSRHRLVIAATDHGQPALSTEAVVLVDVIDEDDNAPKFSHLFHAEVPEDLKNSSYRLRVRVSDGTWAVQTGAAVTVLDVNDNAPQFERSRYVFLVNRDQVNQTVGSVSAADADEGANGQVRYRIRHDVRYISIDASTGELRLLSVPPNGLVIVTVIAQDDGIPAMTSSASVVIVFDPVDQARCEIGISRNFAKGTILGNVEELCSEYGLGKQQRRFLSNDSLLHLNPSGDLLLADDAENLQEGSSQVELISELENGRTQMLHIRLELTSENSNPPLFDEKIYHFTVLEDVDVGEPVGMIRASDPDAGLAGKLRYRIVDEEVPFRLLPNGSLIVTGGLDYEARKRYVFNVIAVDGGWPMRNASAQVVVDLLDVNDNPPVVEDVDPVYAVTSTDDLICPTVTDVDSPRGDLKYLNSETSDNGCFSITGEVPPTADLTITDGVHLMKFKITLGNMIPREPIISDQNVTISESAVLGTILASYSSEVFVEPEEQLSAESNELRVSTGKGVKNGLTTVYAKSKFGRVLRSAELVINTENVAPSPVFAKTFQEVIVGRSAAINTTVQEFAMTVPADCQLRTSDGLPFCLSSRSSLVVCGPLRKPFYSVPVEVVCDNATRSRSEIRVTVDAMRDSSPPTIVGYITDSVPSVAILPLLRFGGQKTSYRIGDRRLRELFSMTPENVLISLRPLSRAIRSIYDIPIVAQHDSGRLQTRRVLVFVDANEDNRVVPDNLNTTVVFADGPLQLDLSQLLPQSSPSCTSLNEPITVTSDCRLMVDRSVDNTVVTATGANATSLKIRLESLKINEDLKKSALKLVFYAAPAGVADLLSELRRSYAELTFYPLAITRIGANHHALSLSVVDRNGRIISASDTRDIARGFFQKDEFSHAILDTMFVTVCDETTCANGGRCHQLVSLDSDSSSFLGSESIWVIPRGNAKARCSCSAGFRGEFCEEVDRCEDAGKCSSEQATCEETCKNGVCAGGECACLDGFTGADCTIPLPSPGLRKKAKKQPDELKKPVKPKTKCSELNCGDGRCRIRPDGPVCQCTGGFEALDCALGMQSFTMTSGSIDFFPTDQLRSALLSSSSSSSSIGDFCNGSRSIQIDFRTDRAHAVIARFSYEAEFAVIEVYSSMLRYRVFDSYRTPVEITLTGQPVNDGNWHTVVLELSSDRKMITFKVDGIGKQALSRVVLPSIISPDLRRIQLGVSEQQGQFSGCLRRFVVNGQLQSLDVDDDYPSELFTRSTSGDVMAGCSLTPAPRLALLQKPEVLLSLISLAIVLGSAVVIVTAVRMIRRRKAPPSATSSWKQAQEIDAYAMQKSRSMFSNGHVNRAMSGSVEGPIYASADGYETPIQRPPARRPPKSSRTVDDVVLAVRPTPSLSTNQYLGSSGGLGDDGDPPRGMYRNVAYF